ncbi:MAG TPA: GNAT family N-acetyltransferase, partial [Gaiellaceae bacterium]|nr:GNAT family N-acetyltransferase [Gaiellaceae bacterium]
WLHTIAFETNTWLFEEDGRLMAAAFAQCFGERGNGAGAVRPSAWGRGLGAILVETMEQRLIAEGARCTHSWAVAGDQGAEALLASRGYSEARRFWEMAVEFVGETPEPSVPVEAYADADAEAFHSALEESFAEHWEHEPEPFAAWWSRQQRRANFDPSLWFVIRDGDEIAGAARCEARPPAGWVGALGVRKPWRGRSYGRALLQHSFREFQRRGYTRAALGVDASNETGATQLYESVGMHPEQEMVVWEKVFE